MSSNYYLISSSTLFFIPALYGIYKGHLLLPALTLTSTAASIYYLRNPITGRALQIDMALAKTSGAIYFLYGVSTVNNIHYKISGYMNLVLLLSAYYYSCKFHRYNNQLWIPCHMLFHYFSVIGQLIVL